MFEDEKKKQKKLHYFENKRLIQYNISKELRKGKITLLNEYSTGPITFSFIGYY